MVLGSLSPDKDVVHHNDNHDIGNGNDEDGKGSPSKQQRSGPGSSAAAGSAPGPAAPGRKTQTQTQTQAQTQTQTQKQKQKRKRKSFRYWIERFLLLAIAGFASAGWLSGHKRLSALYDGIARGDPESVAGAGADGRGDPGKEGQTGRPGARRGQRWRNRNQRFRPKHGLSSFASSGSNANANSTSAAGRRRFGRYSRNRNRHDRDLTGDSAGNDNNNNNNNNNNESQNNQNDQNKDPKSNPLNIVLFYADDWTMKVLGKLDPNVKTPHIDAMADNGVLFLNNCVTTSVCWISRATLMTGTYYSRHRTSTPSSKNLYYTHDWNQTLFPRLRREAGYYTGLVGKWHAPQVKEAMDAAFDDHSRLYYGDHWLDWFSPRDNKHPKHVTDLNRRHSIDFLRKRPTDKPFCLKVSFFATHAVDGAHPEPSYQPMNETGPGRFAPRFSLYPDDPGHANYTEIRPPKTATDRHWRDLPYFFQDWNAGRLRWKNRFEPHLWQKNIRDLYAMATEVDWAIGEILEELRQQGVYENTLLVFTTDNGDLHGEHGLAEKWYPFEESLRVPLVVVDPRMPLSERGTSRNEWTLNVDLAPTLLGAAGLEPSPFMQGRDLADLYLDKGENGPAAQAAATTITTASGADAPWRTDWFYEWNMGHPSNASGHEQENFIDAAFALVTDEWKYVYWPQKEYEQLYHRSLDLYDEYDVLKNYHLHHGANHQNHNATNTTANIHNDNDNDNDNQNRNHDTKLPREEVERMAAFSETETTPYGDSVRSTMEIYTRLKARFHELKDHVQSGNRV